MQRYSQTAAPTSEPVTLAEATDQVRFVDPLENGYVEGLIAKARKYAESRLERQLITATWALYLDGFPSEIEIRKPPVATVTSVAYVDTAGDSQTLSSALYQTDLTSLDTPGRIKPAYGQSWPTTRADTYSAVTVTFTAGYGAAADVPTTIKHAILLLVAHWFEQREPLNIGNIVNVVPYTVMDLLAAESWGAYA